MRCFLSKDSFTAQRSILMAEKDFAKIGERLVELFLTVDVSKKTDKKS